MQAILDGPLSQAIERNQSILAPELRDAPELVLFVDGQYQRAAVATIDADRVLGVMDYIVRGLYYHEEERLPDTHQIRRGRSRHEQVPWVAEMFARHTIQAARELGAIIFRYVSLH